VNAIFHGGRPGFPHILRRFPEVTPPNRLIGSGYCPAPAG
jgi:hypothetical protein